MRHFSLALVIALFATSVAVAAAAGPMVVPSGQEHWMAGTGMLKGAQVAVLAGNPMKPGLYIVRVKVPAGTVFGPHYHNEVENVMIVSGTLLLGLGDKVNKSKTMALSSGGFVQVPAKLHHYAIAKTAVVLDIAGMGPETMMAVKP